MWLKGLGLRDERFLKIVVTVHLGSLRAIPKMQCYQARVFKARTDAKCWSLVTSGRSN